MGFFNPFQDNVNTGSIQPAKDWATDAHADVRGRVDTRNQRRENRQQGIQNFLAGLRNMFSRPGGTATDPMNRLTYAGPGGQVYNTQQARQDAQQAQLAPPSNMAPGSTWVPLSQMSGGQGQPYTPVNQPYVPPAASGNVAPAPTSIVGQNNDARYRIGAPQNSLNVVSGRTPLGATSPFGLPLPRRQARSRFKSFT